MPSPFPGMNPYLEHPQLWAGVHLLLIAALTESLAPQLRPKYRVAVEVRVYETMGEKSLLVGIPDVTIKSPLTNANSTNSNVAVASPPIVQAQTVTIPMPEIIKEGYLEVREVATGKVVTVIEILSPKNKNSGEGRRIYETKRQRIFGSLTHFVEIDLLRSGEAMPVFDHTIEGDYRILVSRSDRRPFADLYTFNLADVIPTFSLPLPSEDVQPLVDLQGLINGIYEKAGYDLGIDYNIEPVPQLKDSDLVWVDALLREQGLR